MCFLIALRLSLVRTHLSRPSVFTTATHFCLSVKLLRLEILEPVDLSRFRGRQESRAVSSKLQGSPVKAVGYGNLNSLVPCTERDLAPNGRRFPSHSASHGHGSSSPHFLPLRSKSGLRWYWRHCPEHTDSTSSEIRSMFMASCMTILYIYIYPQVE